jgi:hypothetical protein
VLTGLVGCMFCPGFLSVVHHRKCGEIFFVRDVLGEAFFDYTSELINNGVSPFSFSYHDTFCFSI